MLQIEVPVDKVCCHTLANSASPRTLIQVTPLIGVGECTTTTHIHAAWVQHFRSNPERCQTLVSNQDLSSDWSWGLTLLLSSETLVPMEWPIQRLPKALSCEDHGENVSMSSSRSLTTVLGLATMRSEPFIESRAVQSQISKVDSKIAKAKPSPEASWQQVYRVPSQARRARAGF